MEIFNQLPVVIRNYVIDREIGKGGFGTVYHGTCSRYCDFEFAIKVSPLSANRCAQIETAYSNEVGALQKLDHPHVVRLYDFFAEGSLLFVVLEYCPGGDLEARVRDPHKMDLWKQMEIANQIVSAVIYCHENCIAHRDIKTANILFDAYGRVKVADFGLCKETKGFIDTYNGSLLYAPPEILRGICHNPFQADIWSLGVLLYRLATGEYPWPLDSSRETLRDAILHGQYTRPATAHPLLQLVKRMIVVEPSRRMTYSELAKIDWKQFAPPPPSSPVPVKSRLSIYKSVEALPALKPLKAVATSPSSAQGFKLGTMRDNATKPLCTSMAFMSVGALMPKRGRKQLSRYASQWGSCTFSSHLQPIE